MKKSPADFRQRGIGGIAHDRGRSLVVRLAPNRRDGDLMGDGVNIAARLALSGPRI